MKKIMFVCHGNICRSPMAEYVMKDMVNKKGIGDSFLIESSATSSEELGNPVHRGTLRKLAENNVPAPPRYATLLEKSDYIKYDLFICMDGRNVANAKRILGGDPEGKIRLLMDYTGESRDVADPWYTGNFDDTYRDITFGIKCLLKRGELI